MISKVKRIIFILFVFQLHNSCDKNPEYPLSNVKVDIYINLDYAEYSDLEVPGGSVIEEGGINGVIIYCESPSVYKAYEITCPNEPDENCKVEIKGGYAECPCCKSQYFLSDGSVSSGSVSQWPLKPYEIIYNNPYIRVVN